MVFAFGFRGIAAWLLGVSLIFSPLRAFADPTTEIRELAGAAEALLDALEPEEASRILQKGRRSPSFKRADRSARALLLVTLGRARAELSDEPGMNEAFESAVALDPRVRLSRGNTSPKIIAALERARLEAPVASKPAPSKASRPSRPKAAPPKSEPTISKLPTEKNEPPALAWWIEGPLVSGARVSLVADIATLPKDTTVEAHRLYDGQAHALRIELTKSGTTAVSIFSLDERPFDLWILAKHKGQVVARAGSAETPMRFAPKTAPSLTEAWSPKPKTSETKSSTIAATAAPPRAVEERSGDATGDPVTLLVTLGMIGLMVTAVIVSVALLTGGPDCEVTPGTGCSEVRVLPLVRF